MAMNANTATVLCDKEDRTCKKLEKERVDWLEAFFESEPCLQTKNGVLKKASSGDSGVGGAEEEKSTEEDTFVLKERAKKTRKLTRELREFTGMPSEGDRKCEGWSDEGMVAFENCVETVKKDEEDGKHGTWDKACRDVMEELGHAQREHDEPLQKARCEPNLAVVCEGSQSFNVAVHDAKCQVSFSKISKCNSFS